MSDIVETIEYKGHNIDICYDSCDFSPRENDNICVFHIAHKRYSFGDKNYNNYEDIKIAENEAKRNGDIVLPLYMYDHSGITISLSPFSCPWDSGQVGFVQVPKKKMIEEFGKKVFTPALKKRALEIAEAEVSEMDSYCRGEVYGFNIDDGEDSCWGFVGDIKYCIEEAKGSVDCMVKYNTEQHCEKLKKQIKNKVPLEYRTKMKV